MPYVKDLKPGTIVRSGDIDVMVLDQHGACEAIGGTLLCAASPIGPYSFAFDKPDYAVSWPPTNDFSQSYLCNMLNTDFLNRLLQPDGLFRKDAIRLTFWPLANGTPYWEKRAVSAYVALLSSNQLQTYMTHGLLTLEQPEWTMTPSSYTDDCIRVANINGDMLDVNSKCSVAMVRPVFVIDKNHDIPHSCIKNPIQKG